MLIDARCWNYINIIDSLRDSVLSEALEYLYVPLGKAANTEIKRFLWSLEANRGFHQAVPPEYFSVHSDWSRGKKSRTSPWIHYGVNDAQRFYDDAHRSFLFSVVRNPYSKLLSGYLDKIYLPEESNTEEARLERVRRYGLPVYPESFSEFVEIIASQDDRESDVHWTSQNYRLLYQYLPYDFIGYFENLDVSLSHISRRLGASVTWSGNSATHKTSASDKVRSYYTPNLAKMVYNRYGEDFASFGYSEDIENALPLGSSISVDTQAKHAPRFCKYAHRLCELVTSQIQNRCPNKEAFHMGNRVREEAEQAGDIILFDETISNLIAASSVNGAPAKQQTTAAPAGSFGRLPDFLTEIPSELARIKPPASVEEIQEAEEIRRPYRLPNSGPGYVVDYVRAFRLAFGQSIYIEVGSRDKGNIAWLAGKLANGATIVDVDLHHVPEATGRLQHALPSHVQYHQVEGNSIDRETLATVREILAGRKADVIFLDSSHVYSHFLAEFSEYYELLGDAGALLVHDIFWEGNDNQKGKAQAAELLDRYLPVYTVFMNAPPARFFYRPSKKDVWGGFGIIPKRST